MTFEPLVPSCPDCSRPMQLNTAASTDTVKQFICGCDGRLKYHNAHKGQLEKKKAASAS